MYNPNIIDSLYDAVNKLIEENPDNLYNGTIEDSCSYVAGKCSNGSIGCLIGQALDRIGEDLPLRS